MRRGDRTLSRYLKYSHARVAQSSPRNCATFWLWYPRPNPQQVLYTVHILGTKLKTIAWSAAQTRPRPTHRNDTWWPLPLRYRESEIHAYTRILQKTTTSTASFNQLLLLLFTQSHTHTYKRSGADVRSHSKEVSPWRESFFAFHG